MAQITAQYELMNDAFPAGPLKLESNFGVVQDANGEHMIFASDKSGIFYLVMKGRDGHNELINLSDRYRLTATQKVRAFAGSQNADLSIFLVFAIQESQKADRLVIVRPMQSNRAD